MFCVALLILKMEENEQHFGIFWFVIWRKLKTQLKCPPKNICAVYGKGAVTDWTCRKWFAKFIGTIDILAKKFSAVGVSRALEDAQQHPSLYPLESNSGRQPTFSKQPNQSPKKHNGLPGQPGMWVTPLAAHRKTEVWALPQRSRLSWSSAGPGPRCLKLLRRF